MRVQKFITFLYSVSFNSNWFPGFTFLISGIVYSHLLWRNVIRIPPSLHCFKLQIINQKIKIPPKEKIPSFHFICQSHIKKKSSNENLPKIKFQLQKTEPTTKPSQEHNSKNSANSTIQKNIKQKH